MVEIIAGKYGPKLLGKGEKLNLSSYEEKRLVRRSVARYVDDSETTNTYASKGGEIVTYGDEEVFKTEDEIRGMKKAELVAYAEEIGMENFDESVTKEEMVDCIMNFIEENSIDIGEALNE